MREIRNGKDTRTLVDTSIEVVTIEINVVSSIDRLLYFRKCFQDRGVISPSKEEGKKGKTNTDDRELFPI